MKICFYTDVHWSQNSSIVRSRGEKYSARLENLIQSVNWAEKLAFDCGCSAVLCGGDFFDASQLNSEEISALREIQWAPISHIFIAGNHESSVGNLEYSTSDIFNLCPNSVVINTPEQYFIEGTTNHMEFCYLPYVLEKDRKTLLEYFGEPKSPRIIFSHNDLKDVQYGQFLSTDGFSVDEIHNNCDLFINGHIHHCAYVTDKIINGGNLTGQNFTEDAEKYEHCALIIDTDTLQVTFYINPYAFNFYKLDCTHINTSNDFEDVLSSLKPNAVMTVKVNEIFAKTAGEMLSDREGITAYRMVVEYSPTEVVREEISTDGIDSVDHLKQFENYILSTIGDSTIVRDELTTIMR